MTPRIEIPRERLERFCRRHHIRRLAFFGSVLRDDFRPDSDIDVLVDFEAGHVPGYFLLSRMERELSEILGRKADLRTEHKLSRHFREQVAREAVVEYAQSG